MDNNDQFQTIEGTKEPFDQQVKAAQQEGWEMLGPPTSTLVGESIRHSVYMTRKPEPESKPGLPRRRSVSMWWGSW